MDFLDDLVDPITKEPLMRRGSKLEPSSNAYPLIDGIPSFISEGINEYERKLFKYDRSWSESKLTIKLLENENIFIKLFNKLLCLQNSIPFLEKHLSQMRGLIHWMQDVGMAGNAIE